MTVIQTVEEAKSFQLKNKKQKLCVVSQTTFNYNKFKDIVEIIEKKRYDILVLNTICSATKERQEEARDIATEGGRYDCYRRQETVLIPSKLFEICSNACADTYYIQTLDDFDMNQLRSVETVGITAGASTPKKIIEEVQNNVRINF